jgi:hypothetical protein
MKTRAMTFVLGAVSAVAVLLSPQPVLAAESKAATGEGRTATVVVHDLEGRAGTQGATAGSIAVAGRGGGSGGPDGFGQCPAGHHLSPFEMPIYDDDGLFVVGYETVWFCIPDDLEPAG